MNKVLKKIDETCRKHIKLLISLYFSFCVLAIFISGPKTGKQQNKLSSEEVSVLEKVDKLYPAAESLLGYTSHYFFIEGSTKTVDLGFPEDNNDLLSEKIYDKDVKVSAEKNDFISYEISEDKKYLTVKCFQPGTAVLYVRSPNYNRNYKIFVEVQKIKNKLKEN